MGRAVPGTVHAQHHRRIGMEFENSMLRPTVHDDRYDIDYESICETCIHYSECEYVVRNCEEYEEA